MRRYDSYKDSGIEWIGKIPSHWEVKPLKRIANLVLGKMLSPNQQSDYFLKPYLRVQNINWLKVDIEDVKEMWFSSHELKKFRLSKDDLLVSEGGEVGRTCIWNGEIDECYIQNSVHKVTFDSNNFSKYHLYQFLIFGNVGYFDSIVHRISIAHLTSEKLKEIDFFIPPLAEQTAIATYLDRKTVEIDKFIIDKKRLLELYEEEKKAIINQAVTKGIDPDVKMKDSGIEWLGEIPEHWEIVQLKYIADLKSGNNLVSEQIKEEDDFPVYGGNGLRGYYSKFTNEGCFVLIGRQGALCGNINYAKGKFWATEHAIVCYPRIKVELVWLGELLKSMNLNQYSIASAQPGLSVERIKILQIPVPSLEEQQSIVRQIETACNRIDTKIEKTKKLIDLLTEYRTALISEVVTGKIKVVTDR
jgi:type I restriction enzyme S subunit